MIKSKKSLVLLIVLTYLPLLSYSQDYIFGGFDDRVKAQIAQQTVDFSNLVNSSAGKVTPNAFGDFSYAVPLFSVPGRKLAYPLNLNYSPGIQVTQEAGFVGLGWSISESYVQRQQFGSYIDDNLPAIYDLSTYGNLQETNDRFIIRLPDGRSATVFQSDETTTGRSKFVIEDWVKWSIEYEENNERFIVKDESGIIYVFSEPLLGANSDNGVQRSWSGCSPSDKFLRTSEKAPFHKWLLTAILTPSYYKGSGDYYDPMESNNGQSYSGSWIRIFYEFSSTLNKKKFEYTTKELYKLEEYTGCSPVIFNDGMRSFEETYIKHIVTPTHIAEFTTEEEPYNPISELLDQKWSDRYDEYEFRNDNFYPYDNVNNWPYHNDFKSVTGDVNGDKKRRLTTIKLYENNLSSNTVTGLTNPIKEVSLTYFNKGEATPGYDEERSMLKSVELVREVGLDPVKYSFTYYDIIQSSHLESGTNTLKRDNTYDQTGDRAMIQYYRSANNNPDESMIGPDGFFNSNTNLSLTGSFFYEPNTDDIKMWNLKRVTHPNSSYIEFDYESDEYVLDWFHEGNTRPSGKGINATTPQSYRGYGYRLKSQKVFTNGTLKTYSYNYYSYKSSTASWINDIGRIYVDPIEYQSLNLSSGGEYSRQAELPPTNWFAKLTNQTPIYGRIKESRPDGSSIERYYDVVDLEYDYTFNTSKTTQQIFDVTIEKRGDLIKEELFDNSQNLVKRNTFSDDRLIQADVTNYTKWGISHWLSEDEIKEELVYSGSAVVSNWVEKEYFNKNGLVKLERDKVSGVYTEYIYAFDHQTLPYRSYIENNHQLNEIYRATTKDSFAQVISETEYLYYPSYVNGVKPYYINVKESPSATPYKALDLGKFDKYGNPYEFTDANGANYSVQTNSKEGIPTAIFKNASYANTFFDGFDDENYNTIYRAVGGDLPWSVSSGTWSASSQSLTHTGGGNALIWQNLHSNLNSGNQILEFDVIPNSSNSADMEFRFRSHSGNANFYKIHIRSSKSGTNDVRLFKNSTLLATGSISSIIESFYAPIHAKVIINGGNLKVAINGSEIIDYTDGSPYTSGGIGFWSSGLKSGQAFDNVRIYPSDAVSSSQSIDPRYLKIASLSDANGIASYFEYDDLGRIENTSNDLAQVISRTNYSIANKQKSSTAYNGSYSKKNLLGAWTFERDFLGRNEQNELITTTFHNPSGTVLDQSYKGSFIANGISGLGLFVEGDDEFVSNHALNLGDFNELDSPETFSMAFWFKRSVDNSEATVNSVRNVMVANSSVASNDNIEIGSFGSNIEIYIDSDGGLDGKQSYNAGIQNNVWYHLALVYQGGNGNTYLYINGENVKTWDDSYWFDFLDSSGSSPLTLGAARPTSPTAVFTGIIDDFHVFNRVLDSKEVESLSKVVGAKSTQDDVGNVLTETTSGGKNSETVSLSVSHTYDSMYRKLSTTRPNSSNKTETTYYSDPLDRPKEMKLPGTGSDIPTNKIVTYTYGNNTSTETFTSFKSYGANTLHKTITNDPNGKQTIEYVDGSGRLIASVVDMDLNGSKSTSDLVTEYGYDDLGNLNRVKDPRGFTTQYEFDALSRMTRKKLPDQTDWNDYKYDRNGNLRFTETAEHKKTGGNLSTTLDGDGHLSFSKTINPAKTGLLSFSFGIVDLIFDGYDIEIQDASNSNVPIFNVSMAGDGNVSNSLTVSQGSYKFFGETQSSSEGWHSYSGTYSFKPYKFTYTKYDDLNRITETGEYYGSTSFSSADATNASFPSTDNRALVVYKYDEENGYSGARNLAGNLAQIWYYNPNDFGQSPSKSWFSYNELGLVEWVVQELKKDNGTNITRTIEYEYDRAGNLTELRYDPGGSDSFYQRYTYDALNRVVKAETSLTGSSGEWLNSAEYTYLSDGSVQKLILGENAQIVDYSYDLRGWLTGINSSGTVGSGPQQDRFFQTLDYFSSSVTSSKRQYNGNIAQQTWGYDTNLINKSDQSYLYTYDNAQRLTVADRSGSGYSSGAFDVNLTYDKNGNITTVVRRNETGASRTGSHFGDFFMVHSTTSNRINYIEDNVTLDTFDLDYDANGNIIKNEKHNLKKTTYDLSNMPLRTIVGSSVIQYRYGPDGQRVAKSVRGGTGNLYVRGANGETIAVYDHNGTLLFHNILVGTEIIGKAD